MIILRGHEGLKMPSIFPNFCFSRLFLSINFDLIFFKRKTKKNTKFIYLFLNYIIILSFIILNIIGFVNKMEDIKPENIMFSIINIKMKRF